ncbi:terminase family protein [Streptomyces sp. PTM05]|uniref:Terminase family protein n=1 Tax=Streptantibioticus parmotrematis TaxID=2873249 RepID=A0ABS7QSI5_9ACTN|nr:terminase family protein [Streptantibioticus parmotrematis]MBY8884759.1 terminase family protein [Streptantibioticus parmotrematis]
MSRGWAKRQMIEDLPDPAMMSLEQMKAEVAALARADEISARRWLCDRPDCDGLPHQGWLHRHARSSQRPPTWLWTVWLLLTGRGWGKSRTAAEEVREWARAPGLQLAVIAKNATLVRDICFESPKSGLLSVFPPEEVAKYNSSLGATVLELTNGTVIRGFGAEAPDNLRGWAFDKAWLDEYAAWSRHTAQEVYDMLWFCLREAEAPQVVISTTPKPLPHVKKLVERGQAQEQRYREGGPPPRVVLTRGHMRENDANLSPAAREELEEEYAGTRLGRQELSGELLEDVEGALWKGWMLEVEGFRPRREHLPDLQRVVVSVDPATKSHENADMTAFTVAGRGWPVETMFGDDRPRGYLLHCEQDRYTPTQAMKRAAALYHEHQADCVVIEANNGGDYLPALLEQVDPTVNWRIVHATRGKRARAAPTAQLYEQARIAHVGPPRVFAELEAQMTTFVGLGETEDSPDQLDSAVWALWDLFLDPTMPPPRAGDDQRLRGRR